MIKVDVIGQSISKRTDYIFNEFYKDECRAKYERTVKEINSWMQKAKIDKEKFETNVSHARLYASMHSYYLDVIRYKEYHFDAKDIADFFSPEYMKFIHESRQLNPPKVAALTTKWLLKAKPLILEARPKVNEISQNERSMLVSANEQFIVNHALQLMDITFANTKIDDRKLLVKDLSEILYHLLFRDTDDRNLILTFSVLYRKYKGDDQ